MLFSHQWNDMRYINSRFTYLLTYLSDNIESTDVGFGELM